MIKPNNLHEEWELNDNIVYLNHAAVAPWPKRTRYAVQTFAEGCATHGAENYPEWLQQETILRNQLKTLINAPDVEDIALLKNTSEALSVIAYGLEWQPGDNIVISNEEFPSNRVVWESLKQFGVNVRYADLHQQQTPENALFELCDANTRLIAISSVQFATGIKVDLTTIGEYCQQNNILFCVDAIQSIGCLVTDVQACKADFMVASGHKWMLGPEGIALFYCRAELRDKLKLFQYGWHMREDPLNFLDTDWTIARSARRFECGSPGMILIHALSASLSLLLETGMQNVSRRINDHCQYLSEQLTAIHALELVSPLDSSRRAGIVTFRLKAGNNAELHRMLMQNHVICAPRGGGVRFSPHYYLTRNQLDKALELVSNYSGFSRA